MPLQSPRLRESHTGPPAPVDSNRYVTLGTPPASAPAASTRQRIVRLLEIAVALGKALAAAGTAVAAPTGDALAAELGETRAAGELEALAEALADTLADGLDVPLGRAAEALALGSTV
jgi:hypothetical protein